ncbi:hypothetical protein MKO06_06455 [Gramella sp. GC03-9]|uniref:Uncharacterized protein n=1 Tax=Christiangramia oceanisediminis TaxID=2920386 RepID=A0A9X2I477_9FLAO|nr:hypothetical protein [Gramella oceanisediminis]MCP9199540.1 hypothetical protein [Gramella oceanisediminis]
MKQMLLSFLLFLPIFALSQDKKIEREKDIDLLEMPKAAQRYIQDNLPENHRKLRNYYETDGEKESYESKFKFQGNRYSVEFNKNGKLEDIEVTLKKRELQKDLLEKIENYLETQHDRFKIEKIQAQYLAGNKHTSAVLPGGINENVTPDNYELIVATKNDGKLKKFEMLFDSDGNFVSEREIIRNSYDYLIF